MINGKGQKSLSIFQVVGSCPGRPKSNCQSLSPQRGCRSLIEGQSRNRPIEERIHYKLLCRGGVAAVPTAAAGKAAGVWGDKEYQGKNWWYSQGRSSSGLTLKFSNESWKRYHFCQHVFFYSLLSYAILCKISESQNPKPISRWIATNLGTSYHIHHMSMLTPGATCKP